jgi:hypothetical protein
VLDHLRRNQLIATSNLMINAPIEYKRSRANHSTGRSYSILTWVAVIDEPTQLTARLTLYDLIDMVTELGLEPPQITVLMGPAKVDDVMSTSALKVPHSLERPTSPASFALASANHGHSGTGAKPRPTTDRLSPLQSSAPPGQKHAR